jgi:hypothetical protein
MADKDLNSLKKDLYKAFKKAISREKFCNDNGSEEAGAAYLNAAANLARSIVKVEEEQRHAEEEKSTRRITLDKPSSLTD